MKKLSILLATVIVSTVGFSQTSIDPEVGLNLSNVRTKTGDNDATTNDAAIGLRAGAGVNISLCKGLYLKPGVYYNMLRSEDAEGHLETTTT